MAERTLDAPTSEHVAASARPLLLAIRADVLSAMRLLDRADTNVAHMRLTMAAAALDDALEAVRS